MHWIDWTVVAAYIGVLGLIAVKARRTRGLEDFTVASREMPRGMVFATLSATYIGPAYTLGIAGNAADRGYVWFLIAMMVPLQTGQIPSEAPNSLVPDTGDLESISS